jgi:hypothetical protein
MPAMLFGLLEWFGEMHDPGSRGSLAFSAPKVRWRPGIVVFLHTLLAYIGFGVLVWSIVYFAWGDWGWLTFWSCLLLLYLLAAHYLIPDADFDNLGWFGGLFDNPFRWSDDWNRLLVFLWIMLCPGRFMTVGMRDGILWCEGGLPREPFTGKKSRRSARRCWEESF